MSKNKKRNKEIREKHNLEQKIQDNPEWCYCDEPDYDINNPIGRTEPIDGFPFPNSKGCW